MALNKKQRDEIKAEATAAAERYLAEALAMTRICEHCHQQIPPYQHLPKPDPDEVMAVWLVQTSAWFDDQSILRGMHPDCPERNHFRSQAAYDRYSD